MIAACVWTQIVVHNIVIQVADWYLLCFVCEKIETIALEN